MLLRLSFPDIENLPFPGYESEEDLKHPAGEDHSLPVKEVENFSGKPVPKVLAPGTKIFRIVDEQGDANGSYWAYSLPQSKANWRAQFAVKQIWNDNGYYIEYEVGSEGLPAWEGSTASQSLSKQGFHKWVLEGGDTQLFIPNSRALIPKDLSKIPTNWSKK